MLQSNDDNYSSQIMVYKDIGEEMLEHAFEGKTFSNLYNISKRNQIENKIKLRNMNEKSRN